MQGLRGHDLTICTDREGPAKTAVPIIEVIGQKASRAGAGR
ncbi:hypothetical protein DEDE109153_02505 [Deinococcus deserti]